MNKLFVIAILFSLSSNCFSWQTTARSNASSTVHAAWQPAIEDGSVSLVVACMQGMRNATASISTGNMFIGQGNMGEQVIFGFSRGSQESKSSGFSSIYARVVEDRTGLYLGEGQQGLSMVSMLENNDWMKVYWQFVAPSRGKWLSNIIGEPSSTPQRSYTFDLRGFGVATLHMKSACGW